MFFYRSVSIFNEANSMFFSGFGTDDENELPGSTDWFNLDAEIGLGRANKRADLEKVESLLANSGDLDLSEIGGPRTKAGEPCYGFKTAFFGMAPNGAASVGSLLASEQYLAVGRRSSRLLGARIAETSGAVYSISPALPN
jgi:hypothetical protein